jgi:hypothetical protein
MNGFKMLIICSDSEKRQESSGFNVLFKCVPWTSPHTFSLLYFLLFATVSGGLTHISFCIELIYGHLE